MHPAYFLGIFISIILGNLVPILTLIEPFDILLHATEDGVNALQARFSTWLRTLTEPARFLCWQMPATLDAKIAALGG